MNNHISKLQRKALMLMTFERHDAHTKPLFTPLNIMTIHENIFYSNIKLTYDVLKLKVPTELQNILKLNCYDYSINTREEMKS